MDPTVNGELSESTLPKVEAVAGQIDKPAEAGREQPWKAYIEEIRETSGTKGDHFNPSEGFNDHSLAG
ncbi:hypothetical protein NLG97_g4944 [Lecanicillium saksenae]|uniref:Uncharacterized protein n=1 Tax=Lecanicillium saksenae TaxID=468837 RepID=A0ACC1QX27_9HYPO|nr:hypothetical protein NLG97_g4944 [Lecanicillium saksenae]